MKKTLRFASAIIALASTGTATPVLAQQIGDRVRVSHSDSTTIGEVTAVSDRGFEIVRDSTLFSFKYQLIEGLDRSIGRKRPWLEWAARGAYIPIRIGFELIAGCGEIVDGDVGKILFIFFCLSPGLGIMLVGAPIGAVVGGIAGILTHREEWEPVPLGDRPGRLTLVLPRFSPDGHIGLNLGVRIRIP